MRRRLRVLIIAEDIAVFVLISVLVRSLCKKNNIQIHEVLKVSAPW